MSQTLEIENTRELEKETTAEAELSAAGETSATASEDAVTLFPADAEVRVSDLVGDIAKDLRASDGASGAEKIPASSLPLAQASLRRRAEGSGALRPTGVGLRLGWYDWAIVLLIVLCTVAGTVCLLHGV